MECVSLFSGAGGLDLGFRAAGFSTIAAVEIDEDCCNTLKTNGFKHVFCEDILSWLDRPKDLKPDVLIGGPPCQPFSKSAYWSGTSAKGLADARAGCVASFFEVVQRLRPRVFLIENVPGFLTAGGVQHVEAALGSLREQGLQYHFTYRVLNCADYGVPQKRMRFFGVGSLLREFEFPEVTHTSTNYASAWDALRHFKRARSEDLQPKGKWADLLQTIPEGQNYLWHTAQGGGEELFGWRTRYWSFLQKLSKAEPAPTIVATPAQDSGPFHWTNRQLSTRELAALQTFPKSYNFVGSRSSRRRQIGNAVPPLMAEVLARQIAAQLGFGVVGDLTHSVKCDERVPAPTPVRLLPSEYRKLIGTYAPHPGTGRGPAPREAKQRREASL